MWHDVVIRDKVEVGEMRAQQQQLVHLLAASTTERNLFCRLKQVVKVRIQNRIHMFLVLPDPDPLVRGTDPDLALDRIRLRILPFSHRCAELTEIMPAKIEF